jgi:hypothetical protein
MGENFLQFFCIYWQFSPNTGTIPMNGRLALSGLFTRVYNAKATRIQDAVLQEKLPSNPSPPASKTPDYQGFLAKRCETWQEFGKFIASVFAWQWRLLMVGLQLRNGSYRLLFQYLGHHKTLTLGKGAAPEAQPWQGKVEHLLLRPEHKCLRFPEA